MCLKCITGRVDISDGIQKQVITHWCKGCGRYLSPPNQWITAELESKELLAHCLKRIKGLNKVRLVDAGFVWTEPHSKRLKVKLTIQKEVFNGTILQQIFIVEFIVQNFFCPDCHRVEAKDTWNAVAQVRQKVDHKRTFLWIEQMILRYKFYTSISSIKECPDGLDFFFNNQSNCVKFLNFLQSMVPIRYKKSSQLVSQDVHSNTTNSKYTFSVEIPPLCKDDLVCLPQKLAATCGSISPLLLCHKVTNTLYFIDPFTLQLAEISNQYWHNEFTSLADRRRLCEFVVLDIELLGPTITARGRTQFALAEATVARTSDLGFNDKTFYTVTHLGNILNPGDTCSGYDLSTANFNDAYLSSMKGRKLRSEIILVRKTYPNRRKLRRARHWELGKLTVEQMDMRRVDIEKHERTVEEFMQDLEEDVEMRSAVNLFKSKNVPVGNDAMDVDDDVAPEEDFPEVKMEELLDLVENLQLGTEDTGDKETNTPQ